MYDLPITYFVWIDGSNIEWFYTPYRYMSHSNLQSFKLWPDTHNIVIL